MREADGERAALSHHTLRIGDLQASLAFYCGRLGMRLVAEQTFGSTKRAFLAFDENTPGGLEALAGQGITVLELRQCDPEACGPKGRLDPGGEDGYWKIGITLADVDLARASLVAQGIEVSVPRQFRDIGYLCHLSDPDGFQIELLQHRFAGSHAPVPRQAGYPLGGPATFGQVTLRVRDPEASLRFYRDLLGLRLLSRQTVAPHRFTLYFLAGTDECPPHDDLDAVGNREWLWQRPYTTLELQHRWGTEDLEAPYRNHDGQRLGFGGIGFVCPDPATVLERMVRAGFPVAQSDAGGSRAEAPAAAVHDPDGNRVQLFGAAQAVPA